MMFGASICAPRNQIETRWKQQTATVISAAPLPLNHGVPPMGAAAMAASIIIGCGVMRVLRHWLEYDTMALAALAIGIGAVILLALSI
jgi:hypothetical protein